MVRGCCFTWRLADGTTKRTVREFNDDDCLNLAAQQLAYYFLSISGSSSSSRSRASFPLAHFTDDIVRLLSPVTPPDVLTFQRTDASYLERRQRRHPHHRHPGRGGAVPRHWPPSSTAWNLAHDLKETRPWWKVCGPAMALTLCPGVLPVGLVYAGPRGSVDCRQHLTDMFGLGPVFEWGWKILQWLLVVALVSGGIEPSYFAPDTRQRWTWVIPGRSSRPSWLVASFAFKIYPHDSPTSTPPTEP